MAMWDGRNPRRPGKSYVDRRQRGVRARCYEAKHQLYRNQIEDNETHTETPDDGQLRARDQNVNKHEECRSVLTVPVVL
jgi:hypothetical protein